MSDSSGSGKTSNLAFEAWRKEQMDSLVRMGYPDAARAFRELGSVQWAGWMAAWEASRAAIVIDLPDRLDWTGCTSAIEECKKAIESHGLKVKP